MVLAFLSDTIEIKNISSVISIGSTCIDLHQNTLSPFVFEFNAYIQTMVRHIKSQWKEQQGAAGESVVKFVIRRDGMLTNIELETSSNNPLLDLESRRAVINARQLPPLPAQFTEPTLTVHLTFEYKR